MSNYTQEKDLYIEIKKCLAQIDTVVENYRTQKFFFASQGVLEIIQHLSSIVSQINGTVQESDEQEFLNILTEILMAQEQEDYVRLADLLEKPLKQILEYILEHLRSIGVMGFTEYWDNNILLLSRRNAMLKEKLEKDLNGEAYYHLVSAENGDVTLFVEEAGNIKYLHSGLNPRKEAEKFAIAYESLEAETYIIYGFGLGYHIEAMTKLLPEKKMIVLEPDLELLQIAFRYRDLSPLLENQNITIVQDDEVQLLHKYVRGADEESVLVAHYPSLGRMRSKEGKGALEDYFLITNSMLEQKHLLDLNFKKNIEKNYPSIEDICHLFQEKTMILVAAGPSLDDDIPMLRNVESDVLIVSIGRAAQRLQEEGVRMDYIVISDAQDAIRNQVANINGTHTPLLLLSTGSWSSGDAYNGPVYLVYQEGYEKAHQEAIRNGVRLFQSGGSVFTLALDIGIRCGASKIICVGLDLAYTRNCTHAGEEAQKEKDVSRYRKVEGIGTDWVYTIKNLDTYRKWIERRIAEEDITFINTAKGARIHGMLEMPLSQALIK